MISPGVREEIAESELHSWYMCQLYKISEAKEDAEIYGINLFTYIRNKHLIIVKDYKGYLK